ncbi:MAG TPA: 4-(cytidine 5'-diphospho)-2-C-methyl-D-erythritol kinase [Burkholderiales bacterium]|nr:4-(cytidine 5'-diphospho)-2-C-methyl-D-erythritol kinase [Burkholderiales bacterium]
MPPAVESGGVSCSAPAKLNLFLHVIGRRADGYHWLQTLFRFLDYGDTLSVSIRPDGAVRRIGDVPGVSEEQDLALRAARLLQAASATTWGADIALDKRLPPGGGLGGGSSDAATALIALNRLWGLRWTRARLQELALQLGADVPVFVFGRSAFAEGVGERLQAVTLPPAWYLVLVPSVSVSTATVFADPELTRNSDPIKIHGFSAGPGRNDLEGVVCRRYAQVAQCLDWLRQFGPAAMTGSGASVFAAFDTEQAAQQVFRRRPAGVQGFVARGLDRHPLWKWVE